MFFTENQLDEWVRGNSREAQGIVVELVWRLVAASSPTPRERRFPLGDSIGQPGPDGTLMVDYPFEPFVPEGRSFWEVGTNLNAGSKATDDYRELTKATPEATRKESSFVFVTPLSGRRDWQHTWKEEAQIRWLEERRSRHEWMDVRVIDGTKLIDWLRQFPSVALWLAKTMRLAVHELETPEGHWSVLRTIGDPPPLSPQVFLANRDEACSKLKQVLVNESVQLRLETRHPDQVVDFVSAYIATLDAEGQADVLGRCVIVSGADAWLEIVSQRDRHVLVAAADLDLSGDRGTKLLERARRAGHAVVLSGMPGGIPHPNSVPIPDARAQQIEEALTRAGYPDERARTLAIKSAGNLGALLRCLQNASLLPEWAIGTAASELAIAMFLGGWKEDVAGDREVVEGLVGKAYGEWIGVMREIATQPGTPLTQTDGQWRFVDRYEGWYALGPKIFDEHLRCLKLAAVAVLRSRDPALDLPKDERYAASIHGKVFAHSPQLRTSLAETLALLGSHPRALSSCSLGRAEGTAAVAVREILSAADGSLWASLNSHLPALAEASPGEFLDALEHALAQDPPPFAEVFAQEGDAMFGGTYMSGLLWALETLAWDAEYLGRVTLCFGGLAAIDPGGSWSNRPGNSLRTIFLPWLPQTCASVSRRGAAISALRSELPDIAWHLLLDLLPESHATSMGTRKPQWRRFIPDDWSKGVTVGEFEEQTEIYALLVVDMARANPARFVDVVDRLDRLPERAFDAAVDLLMSPLVASLPDVERTRIWGKLVDLVSKHRRHATSGWAMKIERTTRIDDAIEALRPTSPFYLHQRLFSDRDFDLYEIDGDWQTKAKWLEERREDAAKDIVSLGPKQVLAFAAAVQSAWRVGIAIGAIEAGGVASTIVPELLRSEVREHSQLAAGFVYGSFRHKGWDWVDTLDLSGWTAEDRGAFFANLPFTAETWVRVERNLGDTVGEYWRRCSANPYEADGALEVAVVNLLEHGRPIAAVRCIHRAIQSKLAMPAPTVANALLAAVSSPETPHGMDGHEVAEIISSLQSSPEIDPDTLFRVEWAYLPILDDFRDAAPKTLEGKLSSEPDFYCEVIRLVFRSKDSDDTETAPDADASKIAANAYRLLSKWRMPPGLANDGTFRQEVLQTWLKAVGDSTRASGHFEVAMTMLGHALTHVPPDANGLWIDRGAAEVLNAKDASDMRDGFRVELFNSRGVHGFTAGKAELEIARGYRERAAALDDAGFHRFSATLKELAESYELDAERAAKRGA